MTKKELLQENNALRDLLSRIRNRIDAELEKLDEDTDDTEDAEHSEDDE